MEVFLVDDEPDILALTSALLKKHGHSVMSCANSEEAKQAAKRQNYNVYLLDVHLPDGSGFELAKFIQQINPGAAVILMSAYDDVADEIANNPGIKHFLKKPFKHTEVLNAIHQAATR